MSTEEKIETVKDMLTSRQVKETFGVTNMTLHRWRRSGKLPFVEFPQKTYRYKKVDIEKILKEGF